MVKQEILFKEAFVMKAFMDQNFLLETPTAQKLFHEYASQVPVLDYHCHINPQEILRIENLKTSHRYGLVVTIINGVRCVPTE